ncbi:MAG: hypothetical protein IT582_11615 [Opitutaceae bacterium]|nr:hypothetical protein [Opitutaceae bacterium]
MNASKIHCSHWLIIGLCLFSFSAQAEAQGRKKNPTSKLYVADVNGFAQIDTGETIDPLTKRSVYSAQGTVIETKIDSNNSLVLSNGTGMYFAEDTRLEIRKFAQEPFTPNRRDMEVEPSISNTQAFLPRGTIALCTSKMVAGSSMRYSTPQGHMRIDARRAVIETDSEGTTISLLDGNITMQNGRLDAGGQTIESGQQMFVPASGGPAVIRPIPQAHMAALDDMVAIACMARKQVYFDVVQNDNNQQQAGATAFDKADDSPDEIVAVETTPKDPDVSLTVSAARLPSRGQ